MTEDCADGIDPADLMADAVGLGDEDVPGSDIEDYSDDDIGDQGGFEDYDPEPELTEEEQHDVDAHLALADRHQGDPAAWDAEPGVADMMAETETLAAKEQAILLARAVAKRTGGLAALRERRKAMDGSLFG